VSRRRRSIRLSPTRSGRPDTPRPARNPHGSAISFTRTAPGSIRQASRKRFSSSKPCGHGPVGEVEAWPSMRSQGTHRPQRCSSTHTMSKASSAKKNFLMHFLFFKLDKTKFFSCGRLPNARCTCVLDPARERLGGGRQVFLTALKLYMPGKPLEISLCMGRGLRSARIRRLLSHRFRAGKISERLFAGGPDPKGILSLSVTSERGDAARPFGSARGAGAKLKQEYLAWA
jgi:hypothetical protein